LSGELPCSKEEAATLAGIQLHLEEAWPENEMTNHNGPYRFIIETFYLISIVIFMSLKYI
jgi:hypothetical protein